METKIDRQSILIVTAHDGNGQYAEMAEALKRSVVLFGYRFDCLMLEDVKRFKARILLERSSSGWYRHVVWMDADSLLLQDVDELFVEDYDVGLAVKEECFRSSRYGSYVYSGFMVLNPSSITHEFLREWDRRCNLEGVKSDQKQLNSLLQDSLDDTIYSQVGKILPIDFGLRLKCLDANIYVHQDAIRTDKAVDSRVKILHFKGALQKKWKDYQC